MLNISVQSVHFHADKKLIAFVEEKLQKLSRFFDQEVKAEVHLKLHPGPGQIQQKVTEIQLHLPGTWIMDKKTDLTFERAIVESIDTLKRQLIRHKERKTNY
jgi:putative sigma-54 modulation protein